MAKHLLKAGYRSSSTVGALHPSTTFSPAGPGEDDSSALATVLFDRAGH